MSSDIIELTEHAIEQLRRHDYERYLPTLFAEKTKKRGLQALLAFNLELAMTADMVSEPLLGRIRLQWWRDCLAEMKRGEAKRHATVLLLAEAVDARNVDLRKLESLIDAREQDLDNIPPPDLVAFERYADATAGGLMELMLDVLGEDRTEVTHAGRLIARAWAILGHVRAVPFNAGRGRCRLPSDLLAESGISAQTLGEERMRQQLKSACRDLAKRAELHLAEAAKLVPTRDRKSFPALGISVLARAHLRRMAKWGFDPYRPEIQSPLSLPSWRLALARHLGQG